MVNSRAPEGAPYLAGEGPCYSAPAALRTRPSYLACRDGRAWSAAFPAARPIAPLFDTNDVLVIPKQRNPRWNASSERRVPTTSGAGLVSLQLIKTFAMCRTKAKGVPTSGRSTNYGSAHLIPIFRGIGRTFSLLPWILPRHDSP